MGGFVANLGFGLFLVPVYVSYVSPYMYRIIPICILMLQFVTLGVDAPTFTCERRGLSLLTLGLTHDEQLRSFALH